MLVQPRFIIYNHGGVALGIMQQIVQQIIVAHAVPHAPTHLKMRTIRHTAPRLSPRRWKVIVHGNAMMGMYKMVTNAYQFNCGDAE